MTSLSTASLRNLGDVSRWNSIRSRPFGTTRRALIAPPQSGQPTYGGKRRVPGLRREEVALLAGIPVKYSTWLERGDACSVSQEVLDRIARALRLNDVGRAHLADLVPTANATHPAHRRPASAAGPHLPPRHTPTRPYTQRREPSSPF